jgi:hypothetical protein
MKTSVIAELSVHGRSRCVMLSHVLNQEPKSHPKWMKFGINVLLPETNAILTAMLPIPPGKKIKSYSGFSRQFHTVIGLAPASSSYPR